MSRQHFDVLLSFATEDHEAARWIAGRLERDGISVCLVEKALPGTDWVEELAARIAECSAAILVMSSHYVASRWCVWEMRCCVKQHVEREMLLIPAIVADRSSFTFPAVLQTVQASNLRPDVREAEIQHVIDAVRTHLANPVRSLAARPVAPPVLWRMQRSLWSISPALLLIVIVTFVIISTGVGGLALSRLYDRQERSRAEAQLQQVNRHKQEIAQAVDDEVEGILASDPSSRPIVDGVTEYYRPRTTVRLADDLYEGGRLIRRRLYLQSVLIAYDEYTYSASSPLTKKRTHLDELGRRYMFDYLQPGQKTHKQHCPSQEWVCSQYEEQELKSPLPKYPVLVPLAAIPPVAAR
jgi:hypothetical protein